MFLLLTLGNSIPAGMVKVLFAYLCNTSKNLMKDSYNFWGISKCYEIRYQLPFTYSNSTVEKIEKDVKYVNNKDTRTMLMQLY